MKSKRILVGMLFSLLMLTVAACSGPSRSASTPVVVPDGQTGEQATAAVPAATDAPSQVETLMAGELATQTAIAGGQQPADQQTTVPTAVPEVTTAPQVQDPTAVPPTATPEPTDEPKPEPDPKVDCSSPYTVQKGDWVWDIGRSCNIHPNSIIAANNLIWPYIIYPGDVLILPSNAPPFPGP